MHEPEQNDQDPPAADAQAGAPQPAQSQPEINSSQAPHWQARAFDAGVSRIFLDSDGLRPIWRLFLYLAMSRFLFLALSTAVNYMAEHTNVLQLWVELTSETVLLISAVAPALIMARLEGRPFGEYGLPDRGAFGKLFWLGTLWGIAALSVLMLAMYGAGVFTIAKLSLHGFRMLKFAAFWGVFFLIVAFAEEFLLRGYMQFTFSQAVGFWPSAILLSIAFGAIHLLNPGEAWNGVLAAAGIGLFFCLTLRRTGNLWFAVGFHAVWDWGESYLYSVPDSGGVSPGHLLKSSFHGPHWLTGGSVGPEGSVLIFILLALLWIGFSRAYPERREDRHGAGKPVAA
ncbi:MAG: lysostaphin resistance A-like protein [Terriglobales bacterium]